MPTKRQYTLKAVNLTEEEEKKFIHSFTHSLKKNRRIYKIELAFGGGRVSSVGHRVGVEAWGSSLGDLEFHKLAEHEFLNQRGTSSTRLEEDDQGAAQGIHVDDLCGGEETLDQNEVFRQEKILQVLP